MLLFLRDLPGMLLCPRMGVFMLWRLRKELPPTVTKKFSPAHQEQQQMLVPVLPPTANNIPTTVQLVHGI